MKNDVSHSTYLQQDIHNLIKPEYFFQNLLNPDPDQFDFSMNNLSYPYINLHVSFEYRTEQPKNNSYFCELSIKSNEVWKKFDKTETKSNDHNKYIKWNKFFTLAYVFQVKQQIKFSIYSSLTDQKREEYNNDLNYKNGIEFSNESQDNFSDLSESESNELFGECEISLSSIVQVSISKEIKINLKKISQNIEDSIGTLLIKVDQVDHCSSIVNGQLICEKLKKSRWVTCNEPFFVISKKKSNLNVDSISSQTINSDTNPNLHNSNENNGITPLNSDFTPIYQSEVNKKMQYKPFSIPYQILCNMDRDLPIRISFFNQRKYKKPKMIGYNDTTFSRLFSSIDQVLPVFHIENSGCIVGSFKIVSLSIQQKSNFFDYLQSGIKLNYITAIDFTSLLPSGGHEISITHSQVENTNFSSSSSSPSPENEPSHYQLPLITQPQKKRLARNSFMETKPPQINPYHNSFSSSSSMPSEKVGATVRTAISCTNLDNLMLKNGNLNGISSQHERCIKSIGEILSSYNNSNTYPTLGFGAEIDGKLKNCFPLNLNVNNPCVRGIEGIVNAYHESLCNKELRRGSPTLFSPIIKYASRYAIQSFEKNRSYSILVILTEGIINDMQDTIDALVDASRLPLSIILVGMKSNRPSENINNRIKAEMEILNSFNEMNNISKAVNAESIKQNVQLVSRTGRKIERNVVKFILFDDDKSDDWNSSEILKDVPSQLVEWTEMNGIKSYKA